METTVTLLQSVNVPVRQGFRSSQRVNCTTVGDMSGADHYAMIRQKIEGVLNLQHLNYGTSRKKKLHFSSGQLSKTGIHVVELFHGDASYFNNIQYTIATAGGAKSHSDF